MQKFLAVKSFFLQTSAHENENYNKNPIKIHKNIYRGTRLENALDARQIKWKNFLFQPQTGSKHHPHIKFPLFASQILNLKKIALFPFTLRELQKPKRDEYVWA